MTSKLYKSDLKISPNATKKQQMLFAADTAYALSEGYTHIQEANGTLFFIKDKNHLVEVDLLEEPQEVLFDPMSEEEPLIFYSSFSFADECAEFFESVAECFDKGIEIMESSEGYRFRVLGQSNVSIISTPDRSNSLDMISELINRKLKEGMKQSGGLTSNEVEYLLGLIAVAEAIMENDL